MEVQIIIIPVIFSQNPYLIILVKGTRREPYIIALGGVATGSMKAKLQARALPITGGKGLMAAALVMAIIIGIIILAEAVLEVTSVSRILRLMARKVIRDKLADPPGETKNLPITSARPVLKI